MRLQPEQDTCQTAADVIAAARRAEALRRRLCHARREEIPVSSSRKGARRGSDYSVWASEVMPFGARISSAPLPGSSITLRRILFVATEHFGASLSELCSDRRTAPLPDYRAAIFWCARELTPRSLVLIGQDIGGRDHSTVSHGVRKVEAAIKNGAPLAEIASGLKKAVLRRFSKADNITTTVNLAAAWTAEDGRP